MLSNDYWKLTRFIVPLAFTSVAQAIGEQALFRSLTSSTNAVVDLASFSIAFKMLGLFTGAVEDFKYVSIVLVHCPKDRLKVLLACGAFAVVALVVMLVVGFTPAGDLIINDLHRVSDEVGQPARKALYIFSLYPFIDGVAWIHAGLLIKYKHPFLTGLGSVLDVAAQVISVMIMLKTDMVVNHTFYIPLIAAYAGVLTRCVVLLVSYYKYAQPKLQTETLQEKVVTFKKILWVWAPLMATRMCQRVSRPLVNLFVARDRQGDRTEKDSVTALAVLALVFPTCHIPYGWLNQLKSLEATFTKKNESGVAEMKPRKVRIFGFFCFCVSAMWMVIMFWIPGVATSILVNALNADHSLALLCLIPMKIMSFHPIPVANRDLATGWLIKVKRTDALYPSIFTRLGIIVILGNTLPYLGLHGAAMGTTALLSGFVVDAITAVIGAAYIKWVRSKARRKEEENKSENRVKEDDHQKCMLLSDDTENLQIESAV